MADFQRISRLIVKYYNDELSPVEQAELNEWLDASDENRRLFESYADPEYVANMLRELEQVDAQAEWNKLQAIIFDAPSNPVIEIDAAGGMSVPAREIRPQAPRFKWFKVFTIAACTIVIVAAAAWYWFAWRPSAPTAVVSQAPQLKNDIAPGGNKAILTLSNGATIVLDNATNGTIAQQGNARIDKVDSGRLAYNILNEKPGETVYNTLTTPPSGQFHITLPDGTEVWLNNSSSIRYPTAFNGKTRQVELQGEAYFEVSHAPTQPFSVKVKDEVINVLGTSFNIMAYTDENTVKTTLLTGGVKVVRGSIDATLKPGQQAQVDGTGALKVLDDVNTAGVIAWKNGFFHFEHADTKTVMRQLARWYDVRVKYQGAIPEHQFEGGIGRNLTLAQTLDILSSNNIHFTIDDKDRTITIMP